MTVGLLDDILEEASVWFRGVGGWPAVVVMSVLSSSSCAGPVQAHLLGRMAWSP